MKNPALNVPTINKRKRIPKAAIDSVVRQIIEKFHPLRIILFGSYAKGNPRPESDVDLLVVMETPMREVKQAILILQQIEYIFGIDLMVITPDRLNQRLQWGDSFFREVIEQEKVVYEPDLIALNGFETRFRYPGDKADKMDAQTAFQSALTVRTMIRSYLGV